MVIRPKSLEYIVVQIDFRDSFFTGLEIDLTHVNKHGRSNFSAQDIAIATKRLLARTCLVPSAEQSFGPDKCSYFVTRGKYCGSYYKLVICICSDRPKTIGVITFHRIQS